MELDRDRFKGLVNGDETDTVNLEGRVEKSISGQVKERIDSLSVDLTTAVNDTQTLRNETQGFRNDAETARTQAETARDDANSFMTSSEGARDQAQSYLADTLTLKNQTQGLHDTVVSTKGDIDTIYGDIQYIEGQVSSNLVDVQNNKAQTETFKNDAQSAVIQANSAASDAQDARDVALAATNDKDYHGAAPLSIYPRNNGTIAQSNVYLVASVPAPQSDDYAFSQREFVVEKFDGTGWNFVSSKLSQEFGTGIDLSGEDPVATYRWYAIDKFKSPDESPIATSTKTRDGVPNEFTFGTPETVTSPTIDVTGNVVTVTGHSFSFAPTSPLVVYCITDKDSKIIYSGTQNVSESIRLDKILHSNGEYTIHARVGSGEFPNAIESEWTSITIQYDFIKGNQIEQISSGTLIIDPYETAHVLVEGSCTLNIKPSMPLDVGFYVDVSIEGTVGVSWDPSISWGVNGTPLLDSAWSQVRLNWTGKRWVGVEVNKA